MLDGLESSAAARGAQVVVVISSGWSSKRCGRTEEAEPLSAAVPASALAYNAQTNADTDYSVRSMEIDGYSNGNMAIADYSHIGQYKTW